MDLPARKQQHDLVELSTRGGNFRCVNHRWQLHITVDGEEKTIGAWANDSRITASYSTIYMRFMKYKMTARDSVFLDVHHVAPHKTVKWKPAINGELQECLTDVLDKWNGVTR
jgi:hypothetical protein